MQYRLIESEKTQNVEGLNRTLWWGINTVVIFLNFVTQFYLHQMMVLMATQGEFQFLVLHGIHIGFTIYNLFFTVLGHTPNHYFEGFMSLISFFITTYSIASIIVMTYWVFIYENYSTAQALAVVFITLFIVFPGIQSFTYRKYRSARNSDPEPQPNPSQSQK